MVLRVYLGLVAGMAALAGVLIGALMIIVSADVVGRYLFHRPIGWATEASEYILLHITFLGMAWLVRQRSGHVRIDLLVNALPPRLQFLVNAATALTVAVAVALAAYWAGVTTLDHYGRGIATIAIYPVPKFLLLLVIVVGFTFTTVEFVRLAAAEFRSWRHHGDEPHSGRT